MQRQAGKSSTTILNTAHAAETKAIETTPEAGMTNLDATTGTSPDCNFLAALPVSDGTVTIRTMSIADAEAYATGTDDALVKRFAHLPLENYTSEIVSSMIEGTIAEGLRDGTLAVLTIADSNSDAFLGSLVFFDITPDDAEVGYWATPEHRGLRISSRALTLARDISRALGLKRLRARTVMGNPASTTVLLDAGFEQIGNAQPQVVPSGETEMGLSYQLDLEA